ncbi:hypothetical protein CYLTODRAFT_425141 [Cylindrobasidium torrendii FP15055 ss-10]|uniref:EthD domain-containing protein n=1 Tax=Cylindrobasidium torrendii FP15055 ss-10 TaxID=1314674 RepID=A0A0D7B1Z3_9AGAR|nr:hypothetical protein CYLTODRAFT_425141 [Cylindrobasidium torrendii FP15055 ss-10]
MAKGFLCVFAEPGTQVTLDEFQDWYNNEHVPLRLNHLKSFLTGARYSAADTKAPSWVALYDIDDTSTFQHESYTCLRANRSPREADLVKRLSILDRRTAEYAYDSGEASSTTSFRPENPTPVLITHGVTLQADKSISTWGEETTAKLKAVDGWVRTRAFLVFDSLKTGVDVPAGPEAQKVPKYLVVHEFRSATAADDGTVKIIVSSSSVEEVRTWNLYRAYPSIAQGNLQ